MKTTKTIAQLIERELNITDDQYIVINEVTIRGEFKALSQHLVLFRMAGKKDFQLVQYWADGSFQIIGGLWGINEAYDELKARINASL